MLTWFTLQSLGLGFQGHYWASVSRFRVPEIHAVVQSFRRFYVWNYSFLGLSLISEAGESWHIESKNIRANKNHLVNVNGSNVLRPREDLIRHVLGLGFGVHGSGSRFSTLTFTELATGLRLAIVGTVPRNRPEALSQGVEVESPVTLEGSLQSFRNLG